MAMLRPAPATDARDHPLPEARSEAPAPPADLTGKPTRDPNGNHRCYRHNAYADARHHDVSPMAGGRASANTLGRNVGGVGGAQPVQRDLRLGLEKSRPESPLGPAGRDHRPISCGKYRRKAMGRLAWSLAADAVTSTGQLSCLPSCPQYCRATPAEWVLFFWKPVSSTNRPGFCRWYESAKATCRKALAWLPVVQGALKVACSAGKQA